MKRKLISFITTGILFLIFIVFTVIVKTIDVDSVGPNSSEIGLSTINLKVSNAIGVNMIWYHITDWIGLIPIGFAIGYGLIGLIQIIKRKSFKKVDFAIIALGLFYIAVIVFYVFFELVIVNYRPTLMNGYLEASYPSSHTFITICIMSTAIMINTKLIKSSKLRIIINSIVLIIMLLTVVGRIISGVHWITDIIGGLILSSALVMLYYSVIKIKDLKEKSI